MVRMCAERVALGEILDLVNENADLLRLVFRPRDDIDLGDDRRCRLVRRWLAFFVHTRIDCLLDDGPDNPVPVEGRVEIVNEIYTRLERYFPRDHVSRWSAILPSPDESLYRQGSYYGLSPSPAWNIELRPLLGSKVSRFFPVPREQLPHRVRLGRLFSRLNHYHMLVPGPLGFMRSTALHPEPFIPWLYDTTLTISSVRRRPWYE